MKRSLSLFACICLFAISVFGQAFPARVADDSDLLAASDWASSLLSAPIDANTLTIPLVAASSFVANSVVIIDREKIKVCSITGSTLTACSGGRGFDGSTAVSHASRATVNCNVSSPYHNFVKNELIAVESWLKSTQSVNVKDFGAIGDGSANDIAAFDAAVNALPSNGGTIKIPNGHFKILSTWIISKPGVKVEGCGGLQSPVFDSSDTAPCKIDYAGPSAPAISIQANAVRLTGFSVGNMGGNGTIGVEIKGNYADIDHVAILNQSNGFTVSAIKTDAAAVRQQIYIDSVFAQGNASGIILEQTIAARITRFRSVKNGLHAIQVGPTVSCFDVNIDGSIFDVFDTDGLTASAIELNKVSKVEIDGNYFEMAEWDSVKNFAAHTQMVLKLNPGFNNENMGVTFSNNWVQGNQVIDYAIASPSILIINGLNVTGNLFRDVVTAAVNVPAANPVWFSGNSKWGITTAINANAATSTQTIEAGLVVAGTTESKGIIKADSQIQSNVATGTAPIAVLSSTPVTTMQVAAHPTVYDSGSNLMTGAHETLGAITLSGGTGTVTFSGSAIFLNSSSYVCSISGGSSLATRGYSKTSGSAIVITSSVLTESVSYHCIGK